MSYDYFKTPDPEEAKDVTWGDYGRAAASTAAGIGAGSAGLMRHMFELGSQPEAAQIFRGLQTASRNLGEDIESGMTEEGRARNAAGVTSAKFWEHPVSSIALKATGMSPYLLAAAIPGALVGDGLAAMAATGGAAGWLAAGDVADEITKKPDQMSDADLRAQSKLYNDFRAEGDEEKDARQKLNQIMVGAKPALAFILGAGTGVLGPAGQLVKGVKGMTRHGIGAAALEGGATELAEEGYGAVAAQKSEVEGGLRQKYDQSEILDRALTGMVLGAGFGGASGIGGGHGKGKAKADEIRAAQEQRDREKGTGIQTEAAGTEAEGAGSTAATPAEKEGGIKIDPAIKAALDEKTKGATPPQPDVSPDEAAVPATPEPPAQPAPAPPVAQQAAPAEQAPPGAALPAAPPGAEVTSGVTPPTQPGAQPTAPQQLDEHTLTEMARRGFTPEEAAQLTPEQLQTILKQPVQLPPSEAAPPEAPTDISARSRTPAAAQQEEVATPSVARPTSEPPMPSATGEVATAPEVSALSSNRVEPEKPETPAEKISAKPKHKKGADYDKSTAQRAEHAKAIYEAHREPLGESFGDKPVKREVREAMAKKIDAILAKAAEHGLVPRESLPDNVRVEKAGQTKEQKHARALSIPERASGETSPHVIHLRELIGVRNALRGQKFGPKSDERARVNDFLAEHNVGEKGLALLAERRLVEGRRVKAVRGSGIAAAAAKSTKGSEDLPASPVRNVTEELRAQYEKPAEKPKGPAVVTAAREKAAATEQVATPPKAAEPVREVQPAEPAETIAKIKDKAWKDMSEAERADYQQKQDEASAKKLGIPVEQAIKERLERVAGLGRFLKGEEPTVHEKITEKAKPETEPERVTPKVTPAEDRIATAVALQRLGWNANDIRLMSPETAKKRVEDKTRKPKGKTQDEIDEEEAAQENAEREAEEAERKIEAREALARENAPAVRVKPTTQAATAEEVAALAPARAAAAVSVRGQRRVSMTPEQRAAALALLKKQATSDKQQGKMKELDEAYEDMTDAEIFQRMEEELTAPGIATPAEVRDMDVDELIRLLDKRKEVKLNKDEHDIWDTSAHKARDLFGHADDAISEPVKTSDVLRDLDLSHLGEFPKYIQDFVRKRLVEVLDRVPIYLADNALVADVMGVPRHKTPGGYFTRDNKGIGTPGHIIINRDSQNYTGEFERVVIHEALHAALAHRLDIDKNFKTKIQILKTVLDRDTQKHPGRKAYINYALTDEHEFISEALSNPELQAIMAKMELEPDVAEALGITQKKINTLWGAFVEKVRKTLGIPEGTYNLLHETLKIVAPEIGAEHAKAVHGGYAQDFRENRKQASPLRTGVDKLKDAAVGALPNADTKVNVTGKLAGWKMKLSTFHQLTQSYQHLFGPSGPLNMANRLFEARAFMERAKDTILKQYNGLKVTRAIANAERAHPEAMRLAKAVGFDASLHDINPEGSNDHLGKDKMMGVQAKNEIARLKKEWANPAIDPVRNVIRDAVKFFRDIHNAVSRETINNLLAEVNIHDPALAERIHTSGLTEEDRANFANTKLVSALDQVAALKRRQGWYIPFRRYGDYISAAEHELSVPKNATKINDNTLQFVAPNEKNMAARALAKAYLRQASHTPQGNQLTPSQVRKVWVDKNDHSKIVEPEDVDAIPAYRVSMQTEHMEMHETEAAAKNSADDLRDAGLTNPRTHKREEAYRTDVTNIQGAMGTILRSLEKQQRYINADSTQKQAMREMFHDLTLGLSGTTSVKNSMRQRRNVAGMSQDLGRVTGDYARMTTNHLAMLQNRPKIDKIFAEMRDYNKAHSDDKDSIRREEVYKEFVDRIYGSAAKRAEGVPHAAVSRVLQMTRLSFLAGPSFHIINAHEPWTTSLPVIGGDHGMIATARALKDTYSAIGGRRGLVSGFKDIARAYTDDNGFTDYVKLFKETLGKSQTASADKISRNQDMIDYMDKRNLYSNSSIFEMAKYANPESNIAGKALDRADLMANQVGTAIEAINRTVTGLAAYNLEYKKNGGNHEAAMHYAYTTAHRTMGDYSGWNAAPAFNTTLGRPLLQFKKFPQKTYMLLGNIMGGALKGDPAAMKQFAGLMVTHGMVAGALGMPTEPFKLALILANAAGITGFTPDDYEYAVRKLAADLAGKKGGEILSKGLYRGVGIDLSSRMGLDSLLVRTAPKSQKDADIKAFLFDTMAGASASFLLNQKQGLEAAMKGDWTTAIEKISPLRTVGDITKAAVGLAGEKKGPSGKTTQEQFSAWEAAVRAAGFTPRSAAELGAQRGTEARESKRQGAQRTELMNAWAGATGADKVKAQRAVQRFNEGQEKDEQITQKDLSNAAKRRKREAKTVEHGTVVSKRNKAIHERAESVFNP